MAAGARPHDHRILRQRGESVSTVPGIALAFDDVGKTFPDGTAALRGVSFTVADGEFVTVVGPSGSGKSTLLRIASGLTEPSSGTAAHGPDAPGYVFQDPTLLPWRTVESNVGLFAQLDHLPRSQRRALVAAAISLAELEGFEHHRPAALSGGMRMRVSLARSLTVRPSLLLFDEPFGAVDEITRQRLGEQVQRLHIRERFAGLFVTHSVTEAVWLARRVVVLSARPGRVVAQIDVPFPYPRPADLRFDAAFGEVARTVSAALAESFT